MVCNQLPNVGNLKCSIDASTVEKVHFSSRVVSRHPSHERRHCSAPGVPGQPSDRPQHEPDTEKFPQGPERRVGSNRLRAGSPDGRG